MQSLLSTTYFGPVQWYQKLNRSELCLVEACESFIKQTYRNRCLIATTAGVQALTVPVERAASRLLRDTRISDHNNWRHLHWNALLSAYGESPFFDFYADDLAPFFEKRWTYLLDYNMEITAKMCELIDIQPTIRLTDTYLLSEELRVKSEESRELSEELKVKSEELNSCQAPNQTNSSLFTLHSSHPKDSSLFILHSSHPKDSSLFTLHSSIIDDFRETIRPKHPLPDPDFMPRRYYQVYEQKHGFLPNLSILDLLFNEGPEAVLFL